VTSADRRALVLGLCLAAALAAAAPAARQPREVAITFDDSRPAPTSAPAASAGRAAGRWAGGWRRSLPASPKLPRSSPASRVP